MNALKIWNWAGVIVSFIIGYFLFTGYLYFEDRQIDTVFKIVTGAFFGSAGQTLVQMYNDEKLKKNNDEKTE